MTTQSDFSWLPNSVLKNIDLPRIVFEPKSGQAYGGYYDTTIKTIVVVEEEDCQAAIAHEFMHHIQSTKVTLKGGGLDLFQKFSYNKAIRHYFRSMWWEMEALLFEAKVASGPNNKFWLHGLVLPRTLDETLEL